MKRRFLIAALLLLIAAVVLAGCGRNTTPTGPAGHGELVLAGEAPWTLDPAISSDISSYSYIVQLYSGLVRLDDDLNVVPDIAARWDVSDDGLVYTFDLRKDVKFHDGTRVTAATVKYSWERACWPETGSQTAATYLGDIVGAADVIAGRSREISGVRVLGDYTLEVTIDATKTYFISKLTHPATFVVDTADVERGGEWWRDGLNGTGPFKLVSLNPEAEMIIGHNPYYYGEQAKLERVVFKFLTNAAINLYETDEVDVAGIGLGYIDRASDPAGPFAGQLHNSPEISFYYVAFNFQEPPFDDPLIRRAFTLALDRERLVRLLYRDTLTAAGGVLPPGLPGYDPDLEGLPYDPEAARELIRQSSYGSVANLPPITFTDSGYGGLTGGLIDALAVLWQETLGVEIKVRQLEPLVFFYELNDELDQMYSLGWIADYPHPQNFLDVLFRTGSAYNHGGYSDPAFDALLDRANTASDWEQAQALYRQAEQIIVRDAVCIPLTFGQNFYLVKPYVQGYELNPVGVAMLNKVSVTR